MADYSQYFPDSGAPSQDYSGYFPQQSQTNSLPPKPAVVGREGFVQAIKDEMALRSWPERQIIGAGTALGNLIERGKQVIGKGDPQAIEANRVMAAEAPVGAIGGNLALFAPTAMIPGANTYTGSALIGAGIGALQPTLGNESTITNTAIGAGGGVVGKALGDVVSSAVASRTAANTAQQSRNAIKDATLIEGQNAGYVVPQSAVNPSFLSNRLEGIAGKAALGQQASIKNQEVTDRLARTAAGLMPDEPISLTSLKAARDRLSQPYSEVASLSQKAQDALKDWKESNRLAQQWFKAYERMPLPTLQDKANRFLQRASLAESTMEREAIKAGRNDLLPALKQARVALAKNFDVERAVNLGSGEVDASVIGRLLDSGKPLTGELATIGKFQQAYRPYMREGGLVPTPGVSKSEAISGAFLGAMGAGVAGPAGVLAGGIPLISAPVRSMLLSDFYQNAVVRPQYNVGGLLGLGGRLAPVLPYATASGALETLR